MVWAEIGVVQETSQTAQNYMAHESTWIWDAAASEMLRDFALLAIAVKAMAKK